MKPQITLPTTGECAKALSKAEFKLESLECFVRQHYQNSRNFHPKILEHIADELIEAIELLSGIDRDFPD
jgi:hypothetical protein